MKEVLVVLTITLTLCIGAVLEAGCSWLTPDHVQDVANIVECVLSHENEPPTQIATECAVANVQSVLDILAAHRAAERRERDAGGQ